MIVCNNMVIESMFALRDYKLARSKSLIAVFMVMLIGSFIISRLMETASDRVLENVLLTVHAVFTSLLTLIIALLAVKLISDQVSPHNTAANDLTDLSQKDTAPNNHPQNQKNDQNSPLNHPEQ
jgi:hypothetical protein